MATGTISGTVKVGTESGAPASNSIVRAYDRITGAMAAEVTSDVNGEFTITVPDFSKVYTLTAINNSFPGYNAGIDDNKYGIAGGANPITLYLKPAKNPNVFIEQFRSGRDKYHMYKAIDGAGAGNFFKVGKPSIAIPGNSAIITGDGANTNYAVRYTGDLQFNYISFYCKINTTPVTTNTGPEILFYSEVYTPGFAWHIIRFMPRSGSSNSYSPVIGSQVNRGTMVNQIGSSALSVGVWMYVRIWINQASNGSINTSIYNAFDRSAFLSIAAPATPSPKRAECKNIVLFAGAGTTAQVEFANIQITDSLGFFIHEYPQYLRPN